MLEGKRDVLRVLWDRVTGGHNVREAAERQAAAGSAVDADDCALLDLKAQRDQLVGHRRRVERMAARDAEVAASCVQNGQKERAMLALRKKRQHQQLVLDCEAHVMKVEELIHSVEMARVQRDTVEALATGVATLKRIQREIGGVDYVQQLVDEHADSSEAMREITEAL